MYTAPAGRSPSPTGKVAGPKALTDEGPHPNNETSHIEWEILPFNVACFLTFRLFPLIRPGLRPVHLPRRGRLPPAGDFLVQSVLDL